MSTAEFTPEYAFEYNFNAHATHFVESAYQPSLVAKLYNVINRRDGKEFLLKAYNPQTNSMDNEDDPTISMDSFLEDTYEDVTSARIDLSYDGEKQSTTGRRRRPSEMLRVFDELLRTNDRYNVFRRGREDRRRKRINKIVENDFNMLKKLAGPYVPEIADSTSEMECHVDIANDTDSLMEQSCSTSSRTSRSSSVCAVLPSNFSIVEQTEGYLYAAPKSYVLMKPCGEPLEPRKYTTTKEREHITRKILECLSYLQTRLCVDGKRKYVIHNNMRAENIMVEDLRTEATMDQLDLISLRLVNFEYARVTKNKFECYRDYFKIFGTRNARADSGCEGLLSHLWRKNIWENGCDGLEGSMSLDFRNRVITPILSQLVAPLETMSRSLTNWIGGEEPQIVEKPLKVKIKNRLLSVPEVSSFMQ